MPGKDVTTMNKVILMGRLTKNPEIKYAGKDNDMAVARYTLAVNRRYKREGEQEADFISCVTFGKSAEFAQKYLYKGTTTVFYIQESAFMRSPVLFIYRKSRRLKN